MPTPHGLAVTGKRWSRWSLRSLSQSTIKSAGTSVKSSGERNIVCCIHFPAGLFLGFERKLPVKFVYYWIGLPWWLSDKGSTCNTGYAEDAGSIPGSGRSTGGGHGNLLEYSCLENSMVSVAWWATVYAVAKSQTLLSDWACTHHWIRWPGNLHKKQTEK